MFLNLFCTPFKLSQWISMLLRSQSLLFIALSLKTKLLYSNTAWRGCTQLRTRSSPWKDYRLRRAKKNFLFRIWMQPSRRDFWIQVYFLTRRPLLIFSSSFIIFGIDWVSILWRRSLVERKKDHLVSKLFALSSISTHFYCRSPTRTWRADIVDEPC